MRMWERPASVATSSPATVGPEAEVTTTEGAPIGRPPIERRRTFPGQHSATLTRARDFYSTPQGKKLVRFVLVSIVSAIISFVLLAIIYGGLHLWSEVPSTLVATILASIPNYYLNRRWVWGKSGRSRVWREWIPFWAITILGLVLALVAAALAHNFSNAHDLGHVARTIVLLASNLIAFGSRWILKFVILNRVFRPDPATTVATS
jgi:putative flippase GtrA